MYAVTARQLEVGYSDFFQGCRGSLGCPKDIAIVFPVGHIEPSEKPNVPNVRNETSNKILAIVVS